MRRSRHRRGSAGRAVMMLAALLAFATVATSAAPGGFSYRVEPGDSLWRLAHAYGTTVEAIMRANGLDDDLIIAGELLYLPGSRSGTAGASADSDPDTYLVRRGDTLSEIAQRRGVSLATLAQRNGLSGEMKIYVGQRLRILPESGGDSGGTGGAAGSDATAVPAGLAGTSIGHVQDMIRAEAALRGVDPSLALGIASVESDFNQSAVSGVGAVGVMQLMPATARWIGKFVGRPLDRRNTADNITGGVAFLRWLLNAADEPTAVASYYQGLHSVTHDGIYPDTQRYVAKVLDRREDYR